MAKQNINVGTAANDKKGDSLRAAFQKVNANFTELYTELGLVVDANLNLGAFEFAGSTISTTDSTAIVIDQATTITSNLSVGGDILPQTANGGDLGSSTLPWRSLYVSNNTIFIGGVPLGIDANGALTVNGSLITGGGGVTSYADLTGKPTLFDGAYSSLSGKPALFSGSYADLTNKPNLAGTYQFSVAADDSTQRVISTDEVIKFIGAGGITTASDAEGNITITGSGGSVSSLVNGAYTVSLGSTGTLTVPANGIITAPINQEFQLQAKAADSVLRNEINLDPNNGTYMSVWSDELNTSFSTGAGSWVTASWNNEDGFGAAYFTGAEDLQNFWTTGPGSFVESVEVSINGGARGRAGYEGNNGGGSGVYLSVDQVPPGGQGTTVPITSLVFYYRTKNRFDIDYLNGQILLNAQSMNINLETNSYINLKSTRANPVRIFTNDTTNKWEFDSTGSLTLPREGKIYGIGQGAASDRYGYISWDGNSSGDGSGYNTMRLVPDQQGLEDADQYIIIDPTGGVPGHIHIRAGGTQDNSGADLYLGGEHSHVKISAGLNPPVTIMANDNAWIFGTDGAITTSDAFTIKAPNGIPSSVSNWVGQGGWNQGYYSNVATTGGTGTGLTVNVAAGGGGYINIGTITIANPGTGYTNGDVITINNENNLPGTFTIGVAGTNSWTFGTSGSLTLPSNGSSIQSVQNGNYQSKVTVSPFQILSQARTSQTQSYTIADEDFISASSDGAGMITFVSPTGSLTEFLTDTMENGGVYERTVRLNGAGPEYGYAYFDGTNQVILAIAAPAGAVTSIRFSYTRISKIDISPDNGVFNIQSESGQDIDIQSGRHLDIVATNHAYMTSGSNMRLQAGDGGVRISTNYNVPNATQQDWNFSTDGQLTLPNGAVLRNTANGAVAFGQGAGQNNTQSATAIAIGNDAGYYTQGADAVAIGRSAGEGYQGANAIAIGLLAGQNNQAANSIVLNATGVALEQTTANTFTVAPIRNISATSGVLQYNASTKEVSYSLNVTAETFNTDQITVVGNRISTTVTNANLELECNGTGGVVINAIADATTASTVKSVGYLGLPQSGTATTATLAIGDAGKHIYITTTGQTITIPAASSVAYPIGTTITFIAGSSATTTTIAITSDTLRLAGGTSTGTRTLAANGMATAVKVASTLWYINGTGLT